VGGLSGLGVFHPEGVGWIWGHGCNIGHHLRDVEEAAAESARVGEGLELW